MKTFRLITTGLGTATLLGVLALGSVGVETAGAAVSLAGSYSISTTDSSGSFLDPLTLTKTGHFNIPGYVKGTWSETNGTVTMDGTYENGYFVFTIRQMGKNLGSYYKQGKFSANGTPYGTWYALRG